MSRCSPYPPLGYVWKGVCGEALVELMIKVKREWAAAEKERKKERRRQRKKKEKTREKRRIKKKEQSSDERHWGGWNTIDWERSDHQKKREYEPQKLENLSLIEELEQHIVSESLGCSFYNSENFNRRKPSSFPCGCHKPHDDGNIIWTEFLLQKHTDPKLQSTPNRMGEKFQMDATPDKVHIFPTLGLSEAVAQGMDPRPGWMLCHSVSQRASNERATETVPMTRINENHSLHESQLRELLENWVPEPQLNEHTEFDDQEWLFETTSVQRNTTEWSNPISDDLHQGSSTLYPYARYLPEADLYALPFTIIF